MDPPVAGANLNLERRKEYPGVGDQTERKNGLSTTGFLRTTTKGLGKSCKAQTPGHGNRGERLALRKTSDHKPAN
jgi:hypothetical protein